LYVIRHKTELIILPLILRYLLSGDYWHVEILCTTDRRLQQVRNIPQNPAACYKTIPQQIRIGVGACWAGRTIARPRFVTNGQALLRALAYHFSAS